MSVVEIGGKLALFGGGVAQIGGGTGLAITTGALAGAIVGNAYSQAMGATGGSGSYAWSIDSCTPWDQRWVQISPDGVLTGTPQLNETETIVIRLTDLSLDESITQTYGLTVSVTGALAIVSASTATASVNGPFSSQLLGYGGAPPYTWSCGNRAQPWDVTWNGWVNGAPTTTTPVPLDIVLTDSAGTSVLQTLTITVNTALMLAGIDPVLGWINLPPAIAGQPYQAIVYAFAGAGTGYAFSSTELPPWATLATSGNAGTISGTPTISGNLGPTISVTDSASANASATTLMNVSPSQSGAARGYFSVQGGKLYDPSGNLFRIRGADRNHYDSPTWGSGQNGGLTGANAVRVFIFDGASASYAVTQCQQQYLTAAAGGSSTTAMLPILTLNSIGGTATSGNTSTTILTNAVNAWVSYYSTLAPIQNSIIINIANEWGPAASTTWRSSYISAVASLRAAGYTCPIMIDSGGAGQDMTDVFSYAAAIQAADTLQNCIFALHPYGSVANTQVSISAISKANPMVVTLNCNLPYHPFSPAYPLASSNTFSAVQTYQFAGALGMTQVNGLQTMTGTNPIGGSQGAWTLTFTGINSSSWGTYTGGATLVPADAVNNSAHYNWIAQQCVALQSSNVCIGFFEFGPGNPWGSAATLFTGSISGTTLTVSTVQAGPILTNGIGSFGYGGAQLTGSDIPLGILIESQLTQSGGDNPGYRGTYQLSSSPGTIGSEQMWICNQYGTADGTAYFSGAGGPSPSQTAPGQLICAAEAYGLNWCQWSPDDHDQSTDQDCSWIGWFGWFNEGQSFSPSQVKWNPGHYAASNSFITSSGGHTSEGTILSSELAALGAFTTPNIVGYRMYITWGAITQDGVTFDLSSITNTLNALKAQTPARHLIVCMMSGKFSSVDVPAYIKNGSAYGPSSGAGFGYWGACAAIHRSAVMSEYIKAYQAILEAFDGDPYFEGVVHQEDAFWISQLDGASDWSATNFYTQATNLISACVAAAPHTNVAYQGTFEVTVTPSYNLTAYMYANRCLPAETDTYGYSDAKRPYNNLSGFSGGTGWAWGAAAYFGASTPTGPTPGPDLRPLTRFWNDIEPYDLGATYGGHCGADNGMGYTSADVLQSINTTYKGTHATWAMLTSADDPGGAASGGLAAQLALNVWGTPGSGDLGDFLANSANALTTIAYPQNYP